MLSIVSDAPDCALLYPADVRLALLLAIPAAAFAQTGPDARPLLQEVADAWNGLSAYRVSGQLTNEGDVPLFGSKVSLAFDVARRSQQMRLDARSSEEWMTAFPILVMCDGGAGWVYQEKGGGYKKTDRDAFTAGYCRQGSLADFGRIADNVRSAVITGRGSARFEGRDQPCQIVEAQYRVIDAVTILPGMVQKIGRVRRTMCIDPARKLILRDHLEADIDAGPDRYDIVQTTTYERIELNPELPADFFEFHAPPGATLVESAAPAQPKPQPAPPADPDVVVLPGQPAPPARVNRFVLPQPTVTAAPEYSQEAWDEGIQGTVVVLADVEPDGSMHNYKIHVSLGYGLDEKAIECARRWKFAAATENGRPVKGTAWIAIDFRLPAERPEQPSPFRVARPVPPPRLPSVDLVAPTDLDLFFQRVAFEFHAPALCAKIQPLAGSGGAGSSRRGFQIHTKQSECYMDLAVLLRDPALCDRVKPVRSNPFDGSKYDKAYCLESIKSNFRSVSPSYDSNLRSIMLRLGYSDSQALDAVRYSYDSPVRAAYKKLLADPAFLDRVRAGRTVRETQSSAAIRPARPLEYLYQMVAIDTHAPELCARISPNATFGTGRNPNLLRSYCYVILAYRQRDPSLCERLPKAGTFVHVVASFDSLEGCRQNLATAQKSPAALGEYGAKPFPNPSSFVSALEQVGYDRSYAASLTPPATDSDFSELLRAIAGSRDQRRAEFLRRVLRLQ